MLITTKYKYGFSLLKKYSLQIRYVLLNLDPRIQLQCSQCVLLNLDPRIQLKCSQCVLLNLDPRIQLKCSQCVLLQNLNDRLRPVVELKTETPVYHETGVETFRSDGNALSAPTWSTLSGCRKGPN